MEPRNFSKHLERVDGGWNWKVSFVLLFGAGDTKSITIHANGFQKDYSSANNALYRFVDGIIDNYIQIV